MSYYNKKVKNVLRFFLLLHCEVLCAEKMGICVKNLTKIKLMMILQNFNTILYTNFVYLVFSLTMGNIKFYPKTPHKITQLQDVLCKN